jgi:methionine salvage enolase-phosphatase E1
MKELCGPNDNQLQRKWKKIYTSTDLLSSAFHGLHSRILREWRELMASYFYYSSKSMHIRLLLQVLRIQIT